MGIEFAASGKSPAAPATPAECAAVRNYSEWQNDDGKRQFAAEVRLSDSSSVTVRGSVAAEGDGIQPDEGSCPNAAAMVAAHRREMQSLWPDTGGLGVGGILSTFFSDDGSWRFRFKHRGSTRLAEFECEGPEDCRTMHLSEGSIERGRFETPEARARMREVVKAFGLDRAAASLLREKPPELGSIFGARTYSLDISETALSAFFSSRRRYYNLIEAQIEAKMAWGWLPLWIGGMKTVRDKVDPLPFYRRIALPAGLPDHLREALDVDGDGAIGSVEEAWHAHRLFETKGAMAEGERVQVKPLIARMTRVDPARGAFEVFGHRFHVGTPSELGKNAAILKGGKDAYAKRLFAIGEAMRSFGPRMVARWARGSEGERALTVMGWTPTERDRTKRSLDMLELITSISDSADETHRAGYNPFRNVLEAGAGDDLLAQYCYLRHELGHSIDDLLLPGDRFRVASFEPVLMSRERASLIQEAYLSYLGRYLSTSDAEAVRQRVFREEDDDLLRAFVSERLKANHAFIVDFPEYHFTPTEWFAHLFVRPDLWKHATPELRELVRRFVGGESAASCTEKPVPSDFGI